VDLAADVLIPISAPVAKSGRGGRRGKKAQPRYALPGAPAAPLPYLAYHPGSGVGRLVTSFLATKDPAAWLVPGFAAPVMLLIDMAREGRGVTWAPMSLVRADLDNGRLLRAGGEDWDLPISVSLFRTRARMTRAAENFWNAVRKGRSGSKSASSSARAR
jgi:DNA-binding transcriptional LysR family regulator